MAAVLGKGSIDSGLCQLQEKNVGYDSLEGKVGRIYMPKQDLNSMALNKMKVLIVLIPMSHTIPASSGGVVLHMLVMLGLLDSWLILLGCQAGANAQAAGKHLQLS